MRGKLLKTEAGYQLNIIDHPMEKLGQAVYPHDITKIKLSKQNCDEIFGLVDVKKLAEENYPQDPDGSNIDNCIQDGRRYGAIWGFNKAVELNKNKVFTEKELRKAIALSRSCMQDDDTGVKFLNEDKDIVDTIKQSQQPIEIEVEVEREGAFIYEPGDVNVLGSYNKKINPKAGEPIFDSEGCLILKKF